MSSGGVDVVVVGLGAGGELAAARLAQAGLDVVAVERDLVGGECPFAGCTPSKLAIRAAGTLAEARRVDGLAGRADVRPDWAPVAARIREANHDWDDHSHVRPLREAGVTVVRGHGRLAGPGRVVVDTAEGRTEYAAARGVVLDTGTEPAVPPIDGLEHTPYWTNREAVRLTELPESLVVLGAGPIGCELAQVFARYGVRVALVEAADRILAAEEPETSRVLAQALRADGVDVRADTRVDRVDHDGTFRLHTDAGELSAAALLVATGRRPNLGDVGLETVGLDPEVERLDTDERMRAGERLWAVGDITGRGEYTHVSLYQAGVAVRDVLGEDGPWADYRAVSRVTFTDPEVGSVGLTEQQARDAGLRVRVGRADVAESSRGWIHGPGGDGHVKLVADADREVLVGASAVGPAGGEVLGLLAAAVHAEIPLATLCRMHFAYPTFHRVVLAALVDLDT
ncbi:dihydrolipoyl dehydrogenase family protein [Nocardioides sp. MAHUQ-72]|uniref:dihydrolipoyl dehydrogenase family protein n=1 Tax=unclassified Nocardioides TaxID=2615069 RepID=UPI003620CFA4